MVMAITSDNIPLSESTPLAAVTARSELSRVDCKSIERTAAGIVITIPKSKTDQEGQGRQAVRRLSDLTDELERNGVGKTVRLTVQRDGRTRTVETEVVDIGHTS